MSEPTDIRIVRKSDQYKGVSDTDVYLQLGLNGDQRDLVEGDRTVMLNLEERFYEERQKSNIIRVSGKISNLFNNSISGYTNYVPYGNNLYYLNGVEAKTINAQQSPPQISAWRGYVQYDEFSFYRTTGIPGHIPFVNKSASTYNWTMYLSYASPLLLLAGRSVPAAAPAAAAAAAAAASAAGRASKSRPTSLLMSTPRAAVFTASGATTCHSNWPGSTEAGPGIIVKFSRWSL